MRLWSSFSRSSGSRHMPMLFTAKTLSNGSSNAGRCSAEPTATQSHAARAYGSPIALGRLPDHDLRVIDATHETVRRPAAQLPDRDTRSEADLEDTVGWLHP